MDGFYENCLLRESAVTIWTILACEWLCCLAQTSWQKIPDSSNDSKRRNLLFSRTLDNARKIDGFYILSIFDASYITKNRFERGSRRFPYTLVLSAVWWGKRMFEVGTGLVIAHYNNTLVGTKQYVTRPSILIVFPIISTVMSVNQTSVLRFPCWQTCSSWGPLVWTCTNYIPNPRHSILKMHACDFSFLFSS